MQEKANPNYTLEDIKRIGGPYEELVHIVEGTIKEACTILLEGEVGAGKTIMAQAIHNSSKRREDPFIKVNCTQFGKTMEEVLLGESGILSRVKGGTLYIEEIENLPERLQLDLKEMIENHCIYDYKNKTKTYYDMSIILSTTKELMEEVDRGDFRMDLYYLLNTWRIQLPPLRENSSIIQRIAVEMLRFIQRDDQIKEINIEEGYFKYLKGYYWLGNLYELNGVLLKSLEKHEGGATLRVEKIPEKIRKAYNYREINGIMDLVNKPLAQEKGLLKASEEVMIEYALLNSDNMVRAAELLGISKPTLYSKIKRSDRLTELKNKMAHV